MQVDIDSVHRDWCYCEAERGCHTVRDEYHRQLALWIRPPVVKTLVAG